MASNHTGGMDVFCECCQVEVSDELITHPEESYQLVRCRVFSRNLVNEEEALAHWGGLRQKQTNKYSISSM